MKKYTRFLVCWLVLLFTAASVFAQEGFNGPQAANTGGYVGPRAAGGQYHQAVASVQQAMALPNNSRVTLTGNIIQSLGREYYTFSDSTGQITVEIDREYWGGLAVGPTDRVQIWGKLERKRNGQFDIDVDTLRRL